MAVSSELITGFVSLVLTLFVFSYLLGDNALFRATIYLFVGVSAGYVAVIAWHQVLSPQLIFPLVNGTMNERVLLVIPAVLGLLLLAKSVPSLSNLGTPSVAFLVGVGAAVAIGGAILGTIFPQTLAAINIFDLNAAVERGSSKAEQLFAGSVLLVGTISTLVYFQFSAKRRADGETRRSGPIELLAFIGRIFIGITFGTIFAGVYVAALTAFIERIHFLWTFIQNLIGAF